MVKCEQLKNITENHIFCENCSGYFLKNPGRGRPPKVCEWSKIHNNTGAFKPKEENEEEIPNKKRISIPILEPINLDKLKEGDTVFSKPTVVLKRELSLRRFARAYTITEISETMIKLKNGAEKFEVTPDYAKNKLYSKIGNEYIVSEDERIENES